MENKKVLNLHPEDELLLCCARTHVEPETKEKILSLINDNLDWQYLLQTALRHGLNPLLYYNFNSICPEKIPNDILAELKDYFNDNVRKNLLLTGELIKILELFKCNNIFAIPYKGPILADIVYGNINFRQFTDIDIFLPKNNIKKAIELLTSNGYISRLNLDKSQEFAFYKYQRELKLANIKNNINIELKWKFPVPSFSFKTNFEKVIFDTKLKESSFYNFQFLNFSDEDLILLLCIHNAGHYWEKLKWICDISELIQSSDNINWSLLIDKADKLGIIKIVYINLNLSKDLLGLKLSNEIKIALESDKSIKDISNKIMERFFFNYGYPLKFNEKISLRIKIRENLMDTIIDFLNLMFFPTQNVIKNNRLPLMFSSVYKIIHFFDLIKRHIIIYIKNKLK